MAATSRQELIQWINDLLQLNYTKIEQCGTGAAYCQIMDSIYGDVPMNRVKMNAKMEYEYLVNYKILQNIFKAKKIEKPILVEKLAKCKMQDNLEFVQWLHRFWEANFPGDYDPVARRSGQAVDAPATVAPIMTTKSKNLTTGGARPAGGKTPVGGYRSSSTQPNEAVQHLQMQVKELSSHLEGLEKERDFYFEKLRQIEIIVQQELESKEEGTDDQVLKQIQQILYSTEEGFEVPDQDQVLDEEETF